MTLIFVAWEEKSCVNIKPQKKLRNDYTQDQGDRETIFYEQRITNLYLWD